MPTNARARAAGAVAVVLTCVAAGGCASPRGAASSSTTVAQAPRRARCGGPNDSVQIGYGTQRRCDLTSSVGSSDRSAWEGEQVTNLGDLLRSRVPGLEVQSGANGTLTLRVRGATSILGSSEPLLVIDGMPVTGSVGSALAALAPRDVARVDVLKDAGAAIYGSQGANGVVLITTRRR